MISFCTFVDTVLNVRRSLIARVNYCACCTFWKYDFLHEVGNIIFYTKSEMMLQQREGSSCLIFVNAVAAYIKSE